MRSAQCPQFDSLLSKLVLKSSKPLSSSHPAAYDLQSNRKAVKDRLDSAILAAAPPARSMTKRPPTSPESIPRKRSKMPELSPSPDLPSPSSIVRHVKSESKPSIFALPLFGVEPTLLQCTKRLQRSLSPAISISSTERTPPRTSSSSRDELLVISDSGDDIPQSFAPSTLLLPAQASSLSHTSSGTDSGSSSSSSDEDSSDGLGISRRWPDDYSCASLRASFRAISALTAPGLPAATIFDYHFPGVPFKSSTFYDNRRKWNDTPSAVREQMIQTGALWKEFRLGRRTKSGLVKAAKRRLREMGEEALVLEYSD